VKSFFSFQLRISSIGTANTSSSTVFTGNKTIRTFKELIYFINLVTCGRQFVSGCSNLTEIWIPAKVNRFGNGAFQNTQNLKKVYCYPLDAPEYASNGAIFSASYASSMGYYTRSSGKNEWHVPADATGYDSGAYLDPLQNTSRCGFKVIYDL
jgi:hypothetical protein